MSRTEAQRRKASAFRSRHSQSLAKRRQRFSQAMVRSTIQRLGRTTNLPLSQRRTISTFTARQTRANPRRRNMAPAELRRIHPLRKSPIISDADRTIAESGAIVDYLVRQYDTNTLRSASDHARFEDYTYWLHYAEGSAVTPFIMMPIAESYGRMSAPLRRRVDAEMRLNLGYIDGCLEGRDYLLGDRLSAADIQMSFVGELASASPHIADYPNIDRWVSRFQRLPAYRRAIERGGEYKFDRERPG